VLVEGDGACPKSRPERGGPVLEESQVTFESKTAEVSAPLLLVPDLVEEMIVEREVFQVAKFRTTCTDCVPNL
jgi:hypothetical protein